MIKLIDTVRLGRFRDKLVDDTVATSQTTYSSNKVDDLFDDKQDVLTAGAGITIERVNDTLTISAEPGLVVKLGDVSGATANSNMRTITLKWSDPNNVVVDNVTLAQWAGTKVVKKVGSALSSIEDGTVIVDSKVKNQYSVDGLTDNVNYGSTYYYRFFPYTSDGIITEGSSVYATPTRTVITVPTQNTAAIPVYDGTTKTASWNNYDSSTMAVTGDTGINAGSYTATFTPLEDYCWSGGSTSGVDVSWSIAKAAGSLTLSSSVVTLGYGATSKTVTVSNATGDVSVSSGNSTIATASYDSTTGKITITSPSQENGSTTITVSSDGDENHETTSKTINVTASFVVKDWKDGTNQGSFNEISSMLTAADEGNLDLSLYWSIGDARTVSLAAIPTYSGSAFESDKAAQDIVLVLMNEGYMEQSGIHYVIGLKDCLNGTARMIASTPHTGSWNSSAMKATLNSASSGGFYKALSSNLKSILKTFNVKTASQYNSSTLQSANMNVALFASCEVFGNTLADTAVTSSNKAEKAEMNALSQIEYYKTSSNRIKTRGSTSACSWWLRSPTLSSENDSKFRLVSTSGGRSNYIGTSTTDSGNNPISVAPFMCI